MIIESSNKNNLTSVVKNYLLPYRRIYTFPHLHIYTFPNFHILTFSHPHIFTFSHPHIFTFHIATSAHYYIFAPKITEMTNRTFTMIKPDAVGAGKSGAITKMIEEAGFKIVGIKKVWLTPALAGKFYAIHKERPFYKDLCAYMSSGPIIPMILEKENAVTDYPGDGIG